MTTEICTRRCLPGLWQNAPAQLSPTSAMRHKNIRDWFAWSMCRSVLTQHFCFKTTQKLGVKVSFRRWQSRLSFVTCGKRPLRCWEIVWPGLSLLSLAWQELLMNFLVKQRNYNRIWVSVKSRLAASHYGEYIVSAWKSKKVAEFCK